MRGTGLPPLKEIQEDLEGKYPGEYTVAEEDFYELIYLKDEITDQIFLYIDKKNKKDDFAFIRESYQWNATEEGYAAALKMIEAYSDKFYNTAWVIKCGDQFVGRDKFAPLYFKTDRAAESKFFVSEKAAQRIIDSDLSDYDDCRPVKVRIVEVDDE